MEQRANIRFAYKQGKTDEEIYESLENVYGEESMTHEQISYWLRRFREGQDDLEDDDRVPTSNVGRKNNMAQRANIKFGFKLGKSGAETYETLKKIYGDECMSRAQVFRWFSRFRAGREELEDHDRAPPPKTTRNEENIEKVKEILRSDRCVSVRLIEEETGIPRSTAYRILTEDLGKRKISARFVPPTLTDDQIEWRVQYSKDMLKMSQKNPANVLSIVTGDETWCFQYERSKVKTLLTVYFDSKGIIHREFVPNGQPVNAEYYLEVLQRLWDAICEVRPEYREPGSWFFLHDSTPSQKAVIIRDFLTKKGIVVIDHPPYSPDLAPCNFWLFPKLKLKLKGSHFENIPDVQKTTVDILTRIPLDEYEKCFGKFIERCQHCIDSKGDYFE